MNSKNTISNIFLESKIFFSSGATLPYEFRVDRLRALHEAIQKNEDRIAKALASDLGKSRFESYVSEVGFCLAEISHTRKNLKKWMKPRRVRTPFVHQPSRSTVYLRPRGTCLIIGPWNYPFQLLVSPLIGAIAGGNTAILKPSEFAKATSEILSELLQHTFEARYVGLVTGGVSETQDLLSLGFDHIFFTGSIPVGKIVMEAASKNLTPVTLELGGKSPCLLDASADVDVAARRIMWGKFYNAGQTCVAPDYVLLPSSQKKQFMAASRRHLHDFFGKDPKQSPDYGRIINSKQHQRLCQMIRNLAPAIGGEYDEASLYFAPTLIEDVDPEHALMKEEIFGPILPILSYENIEDAIHLIQKNPNPLSFYLFSSDEPSQRRILERIPFGGGCVNNVLVHLTNPNLPFGGIRQSGMGNYHGKYSFDAFTHAQGMLESPSRLEIPLKYPPYEGRLGLVKRLIK